MKMKLVIIALTVVFSSAALAGGPFNYHEIKSGMNKSEVDELTGCAKYCSSLDYGETRAFLGGDENHPPHIWGMAFSYTSDDELWRIQLSFIEMDGPIGVAQLRALGELYPDAEVQTGSFSSLGSQIETLNALMIDTGLFDADAEKVYQEIISKY